MPILLFPKENIQGETRVSVTPETVKKYAKLGFEVWVESHAGDSSFLFDSEYEQFGARIITNMREAYTKADVVAKLHAPQNEELDNLTENQLLISFLWPFQNEELVQQLRERKITSFAMDMIPRTTLAQSMDALSSQSNIAGYRAVILAAHAMPKLFPMMTTAAGTIKPAKVVILGAGVAGLQAIATAKRLGAIVEVSDVRPSVKEQVESLGGKFITVETNESLEGEGGYAKEASAEYLAKQQAIVRAHIVAADVVITTAMIPGKTSPVLITEDMVLEMKKGSVIVDLATERGGNCALSQKDQVVVVEGKTIIGYSNLPAQQPLDASSVYARNILAVVQHLFDKKTKQFSFSFENEITKGSIITHQAEVVHPLLQAKKPSQGESK